MVLEHRDGVVHVLDCLQEHQRVVAGRLTMGLDKTTLEAQVLSAVAEPRVLVGLGIRIDTEDAQSRAREQVGAVALAARHVDHTLAGDPRADPLIDRLMAAKPIVLLRHVRQRAFAG